MAGNVASPRHFEVSSQDEMTRAVNMYVSQGYEIHAQWPAAVTLVKRKEFQIVWAVVGFFLCMVPLFAYLFFFAVIEKDQVIELRLVSPDQAAVAGTTAQPPTAAAPRAALPPGSGTAPPTLSPDGTHWWDGTQWHRL